MRILQVSRTDDEPGAKRAREQVGAGARAGIFDGRDRGDVARHDTEPDTCLPTARD